MAITSNPLLVELRDVLRRPRISRKYRITISLADAFIARLRRRCIVVPLTGTLQLCRDPDDNMVIETAVFGEADSLVTRDDDLKGDNELLAVLSAGDIQILSVRNFMAEVEFVVNHDQLREILTPSGHVSINPRHFTRERSYEGTVTDVRVMEDAGRQILWLDVELYDYDDHVIGHDHLWLPEKSGKLGDFIDDLHELGVDLNTPHDLKGRTLTWVYRHGYSTESGGHLRIPQ